jgi:Tol biopolymer transport system component
MTERPTLAALVALALGAGLAAPAAATPPGTNGQLIWQREFQQGFPHLYVANSDGSGQREVFARPRRGDFEGAFSPADPTLVAFSRFARPPFSEDVFTGNLLTGAVTRIARPRTADIAPAFSPDGTRIAYFAVRRPRDPEPEGPPPPERIRVMNADGSGDRAITPRSRRSIDPDWSPDGTRIVYTETRFRRELPQNRLAVMNADGSGRRVLTRYGGVNEVNGKWMPDGQTIVFEQLRERGRRSDIASIPAAGGPVRKILSTRAWETNPVPSPDGTRIVFTSDRHRRGGDRLNNRFEIYTMAADGSDIQRVTSNRRPDLWPDWQRLP